MGAPATVPLTISATAVRNDIFHAASLIGLHMIPNTHAIEGRISSELVDDTQKMGSHATNYTYYPWTLPDTIMPTWGTCARLPLKQTFSIEFPVSTPLTTASGASNYLVLGPQGLIRLNEGILVKSLSGIKLGMIYESPSPFRTMDGPLMESYRVSSIANMPLGRDEQIFIPRDVIGDMIDPSFTRIRETIMADIVLQLENPIVVNTTATGSVEEFYESETDQNSLEESPKISFGDSSTGIAAEYRTMISSLLRQVTSALRDPAATLLPEPEIPVTYHFTTLPAISQKLANIPSFVPSSKSLKLVIVISGSEDDDNADGMPKGSGEHLIRPLLDKAQVTPSGLVRHHQISMVMVGGGDATEELLRRTRSVGLRRRYHVESQGMVIGNIIVV